MEKAKGRMPRLAMTAMLCIAVIFPMTASALEYEGDGSTLDAITGDADEEWMEYPEQYEYAGDGGFVEGDDDIWPDCGCDVSESSGEPAFSELPKTGDPVTDMLPAATIAAGALAVAEIARRKCLEKEESK